MKKECKLTFLCEDQARMGFLDKKFSGQHGLSIFIQGEKNVLFDTGPSEIVLYNAALAGVNLDSADLIVLSHGHWDHADGLGPLSNAGIRKPLLLHPMAFRDRRKPSGQFNGMAMSRDQIMERFDLIESSGPYKVSENMWFLGEIPRENDFESQSTSYYYMEDGEKRPELLPDDTALAVTTPNGLVVITGCSHAGICNICEYAKKVTGQGCIRTVIGGFHLLDDSKVVEKTIDYFRGQGVESLFPNHCTALPALSAFYQAFKINRLCVGDELEIS
ncbi:MBL fold metallo-hydrolase [Desulfatibacillum aliphaticivorans]|uniref:MBL fold metallo-hydrolase n=1 Tax=Desulfatibacillum aliphaticivorans TaxID=218208 RepID=UPI00040FA33B|nr:MBL fold metallo-hydrolase [Desulfatibacillum aliphaticivorans]